MRTAGVRIVVTRTRRLDGLHVLTRAELAARHAAVETARAGQERTKAVRRNATRAAEEARQRAAATAELERKLRELQPDKPRPRPSPGPSMG